MDDYQFDKLNRDKDWQHIFDTIDKNFALVASYLKDIGCRVIYEKFEATDGQTEFNLHSSYSTRNNCLSVYKNGARQWVGEGFKETSDKSFRLNKPCAPGDEIVVFYTNHFEIGKLVEPTVSDINIETEEGFRYKLKMDDSGVYFESV